MTAGVTETMQLARVYSEANNFRRAAEVLTDALRQHPDSVALLAELARMQICMDVPEEAEATAQTALAIAPDDVAATRMYALALSALGDADDAMRIAYQAVLNGPNDYQTHYTYAVVLNKAWHYHAALCVIMEAIRLKPDNPQLHFQHGLILSNLGRRAESTAAYQEALRIEPGYATAVHNIAVNRLERGGWRGALQGFVDAARMSPGLAGTARSNVGAALLTPMRWATSASILAYFFSAISAVPSAKPEDRIGQVVLATVSLVMVAGLLAWVARAAIAIPRAARWGVLRAKPSLMVRGALAVGAIVIGTVLIINGGPEVLSQLAGLLAAVSAIVAVLGWQGGF